MPGAELHRCVARDEAEPDDPRAQQVPVLHAHAVLHAPNRARDTHLHEAVARIPAAGRGHERAHGAVPGAGHAL